MQQINQDQPDILGLSWTEGQVMPQGGSLRRIGSLAPACLVGEKMIPPIFVGKIKKKNEHYRTLVSVKDHQIIVLPELLIANPY